MQKHGSKPWLQHFVCTETSPHRAHATKPVCTQRERDNSWSIATYNKIIIIIAWLWVSLLAPILYICYSWNMSEHPELTLLQTVLKNSSSSSTSEQLLCFLYKTLLKILLQQFISSCTERWAAGSLACCCSFSCRALAADAEASLAPTYGSYEVTEPQPIPTTLYSPL